ncbi:MAG: DUF4838 domain-containing protein [Oscillospiraceae bacterium]|jgi:hypothetical protein|nr:DUF4838 domain-containing protein [Oscillospiraceae bacterium]
MIDKIKQFFAFFLSLGTLIPSFFGLPSVYAPYNDAEKYDASLGEITVEMDTSVPHITLAENGVSGYVIVRGENASPSEVTAAGTLGDYLERITGVNFAVVDDTAPPQEQEILVGKTNREGPGAYEIDREKLGDDGLDIFVSGEKLVIAGGEKRGTLYGVYAFLEEVLGCRWFTAELTVVPEYNYISVRRDLDIEQIPVFDNRDVYWRSTFDAEFSVAQKINSGINPGRNLTDALGGSVQYAGQFVHTFNLLVPPGQYFGEHPEYYAYTENGKRETTQLCLTNPEVLQIVIANAKQWLRDNPGAKIVSISQNDVDGYCMCESCKAIDAQEGSPAGSLLRFVNAAAKEIAKEFPDVWVDTLAYDYTRQAPSITVPEPNVVIRLCTIECCFSHPINECPVADKSGRKLSEDLKAWQAICDKIQIWDYTTNYSHYLTPYPNFDVLQANAQFFAENNVKSVFEQGNNMLVNNGEFAHLKAYLIAKLLWDPYTDIEQHMNEFMLAFYGKGYQSIMKYIDFTIERAELNHIERNSKPGEVLYLSSADLKHCEAWWDEAEAAAQTDFQKDNIQCSRLQLTYYKNFTRKGEFSLLKDKRAAGEAFYDEMARFGITRLKERYPLKPKEQIDFSKRVDTWHLTTG